MGTKNKFFVKKILLPKVAQKDEKLLKTALQTANQRTFWTLSRKATITGRSLIQLKTCRNLGNLEARNPQKQEDARR